jgi:hypothetical protein
MNEPQPQQPEKPAEAIPHGDPRSPYPPDLSVVGWDRYWASWNGKALRVPGQPPDYL